MAVDTSRSYVLGGGGAGQGQGAYQAPHPGTAEHLIDTGLAHNIQGVWWTPMDNIGDLNKFPISRSSCTPLTWLSSSSVAMASLASCGFSCSCCGDRQQPPPDGHRARVIGEKIACRRCQHVLVINMIALHGRAPAPHNRRTLTC